MANWLQKILPPPPDPKSGKSLPTKYQPGLPTSFKESLGNQLGIPLKGVPNASIVYGITGVILICLSLFNFFGGRWLTGFLILFPAACFFGYAWVFMKSSS